MAEEQQPRILLEVRKLYVGDLSVEVPNAPEVFQQSLNPEISLGINHENKKLKEENYYSVHLRLTVTAKDSTSSSVIYLVEATQTGIFEIVGLDESQLQHALNVYCTTVLYPYAREVISSAITHAGFPSLYLQPINFDALYQQQLQQEQNNTAQGGEA